MQLTRRRLLHGAGALAALGWAPVVVPLAAATGRVSRAGRRPVLVLVFLRGGADGLSLVVPHGERAYYELRDWLAVPRPGEPNGALDLDGRFGLHPWASDLVPLFDDGTAVALQAVGSASNTRSHFEEQDVWETGLVENDPRSDGWLNRHLATAAGEGPVRAVAIGDSLPRILRGDEQVLAIRGLGDLVPRGGGADAGAALAALERAYGGGGGDGVRDLLRRTGATALEALRELQAIAAEPYQPAAPYPDSSLGRRLRGLARLIKADVGLEVAEIDVGGWDTHRNQGAVGGTFSFLVRQLSGALAAFAHDLEERLDDVLVLCVSEFGRTAFQNGTGGTDHGWGNCVLALGGPVLRGGGGRPRKVIGEWPGLEREQLNQGRDLAHTTDFRDVFAEVVRTHLGNPNLEVVLPGHAAQPVGLLAR